MLGDTETGVRVTGMTPRVCESGSPQSEGVRPAQGVPVTVQPVPETQAARIPREGSEPGSRKADRVVLGGASRRDRWIAQASNRTRLGVRSGDDHSHDRGLSPR